MPDHPLEPATNRLFAGMDPTVNGMLADRGPVPFDSVARLLGRDSHAFFDPDTGRCHCVQLRYVFEIAAVGHCTAEPKMQLHEEVRADRNKGFRHMGDFEPGRDAADAADIDLHNRAGAALHQPSCLPVSNRTGCP
jgi:hypothetical protein